MSNDMCMTLTEPSATMQPTISYENEFGRVTLFKRGARSYQKFSYPVRCGIYHELITDDLLAHFNLNHEIIRLIGKSGAWPHPHEWLKRGAGNDWIYYSTGGYTGVVETTGEYYLPNLPYATNNHMGGSPHLIPAVDELLKNWYDMVLNAGSRLVAEEPDLGDFFAAVKQSSPRRLAEKAAELHRSCDGPVSVLPPDCRHVDYQVIPLNVARGCLYKCTFCRVKNKTPFQQLSTSEIDQQIAALKHCYADDLVNYNALFLGQHDALRAEGSLLLYAIEQAHNLLGLKRSWFETNSIFWFGSVGSLLAADHFFFDELDHLPGLKYINIGLESADQDTLDLLGKPLGAAEINRAFTKIQELNQRYQTIEITANFVTDEQLPAAHFGALEHLIRDMARPHRGKGTVYLSPLRFNQPSRARLFDFYRLKRISRLPLFMYTIQRL
jgi:hypothetical protein